MIYFFGDSWPSEICEVERLYEQGVYVLSTPPRSIPVLVGEMLDTVVINKSVSGSSQMDMFHQLINTDLVPGSDAVFLLTAPSRRFFFADDGTSVNTFVDNNRDAINEYQDSWLCSQVCYMIYNYCKSKNVNAWFVNSFNVPWSLEFDNALWNEIPESCWLLPKTKCIVSELFDPLHFSQYEEFRNSDFYDWLQTENRNVSEFIRPCGEHPNMAGREKIAKFIGDKLQ